jgi:hypothetical protein
LILHHESFLLSWASAVISLGFSGFIVALRALKQRNGR